MTNDLGFSYQQRQEEVVIFHNGRFATKLRKKKAAEFLTKVEKITAHEQQQWMARLTGNYKRGNERKAKNHPKNRP